MALRNLSLTERREGNRNQNRVPTHFSIEQIKEHFVESMESIKKQFEVADRLLSEENEEGCYIIWRSQVVLSEGLLDFYIHEISKYCMFQMFCGNWNKSDKYNKFMVPMEKLEEAITARESNEWFFEFLNQRFSRDVFLSVESMRDQLNLIGVGFMPALVRAFPKDKEEESKRYGTKVIKDLFQRRNEIAHQNDRSHASAEQTPITKGFVERYINNIELLVNGIHEIMELKDRQNL